MKRTRAFDSARQRIRQDRGRKTYDALVTTAFELLTEQEFESITVAELARKAGYSVGAFYARFSSKDEFFDALLARHFDERKQRRQRLFETVDDEDWIRPIIADLVNTYWKRRRFWRAALLRSAQDPDFWQPVREHSHGLAALFVERIATKAGRPLAADEEINVRFAMQITLGTINNTIINRPGPVFMGQTAFVDSLARAFRLVSGYDEILRSTQGRKGRAAKRQRG